MPDIRNVLGAPDPTAMYSHVAISEPGARLAHISGQVAVGADGEQMVGDFVGQCEQVFANLTTILEGIGAGWGDVAYVRGYLTRQTDFATYVEVRERFYTAVCTGPPPATSSLVVTALYHPDALVEIDALAVLPG